jgi:hypothetical protein
MSKTFHVLWHDGSKLKVKVHWCSSKVVSAIIQSYLFSRYSIVLLLFTDLTSRRRGKVWRAAEASQRC